MISTLVCCALLAGAYPALPASENGSLTRFNTSLGAAPGTPPAPGWLWVASRQAATQVGRAPAPTNGAAEGGRGHRTALEEDPSEAPEEPLINKIALGVTIGASILTAALLAVGTGVAVEANRRQEGVGDNNGYADHLANVASGLLFSAIGTGAAALISGAFWAGLYSPHGY